MSAGHLAEAWWLGEGEGRLITLALGALGSIVAELFTRLSIKGRQELLRTVSFGALFNSDFHMLTVPCVAHKQGQKRTRRSRECFRGWVRAASKSFRKQK